MYNASTSLGISPGCSWHHAVYWPPLNNVIINRGVKFGGTGDVLHNDLLRGGNAANNWQIGDHIKCGILLKMRHNAPKYAIFRQKNIISRSDFASKISEVS